MSVDDYIVVDLFFGDLIYNRIQVIPVNLHFSALNKGWLQETELITRTIFISSIGGQMSLWLGIRLVSLLQLLYYLLKVLVFIVPIWSPLSPSPRSWRKGSVGPRLRRLELYRLRIMGMVKMEEARSDLASIVSPVPASPISWDEPGPGPSRSLANPSSFSPLTYPWPTHAQAEHDG